MTRNCRKSPIVNFLSRRYTNRNERNPRHAMSSRASLASSRAAQQHQPSTSSRQEPLPNYTNINTYTLSSMSRRLEILLTEQMRVFTTLQARPSPPSTSSSSSSSNNRSSSMVDLMEHILATRLHSSIVRVNRLWGKFIFLFV